jgi:hypothetical protein
MQGGDIGTVMGCKTKQALGCKAVDRGALGSSSDGWQRSKRATQSSWNSTALDDLPSVSAMLMALAARGSRVMLADCGSSCGAGSTNG